MQSLFKTLHLLTSPTLRKQPNSYTENKSKDPKAHSSYCFQIHLTVCPLCVEFAVLMKLFNFPLLAQLCIKIPSYLRGNEELDRKVLQLNNYMVYICQAHLVPGITLSASSALFQLRHIALCDRHFIHQFSRSVVSDSATP